MGYNAFGAKRKPHAASARAATLQRKLSGGATSYLTHTRQAAGMISAWSCMHVSGRAAVLQKLTAEERREIARQFTFVELNQRSAMLGGKKRTRLMQVGSSSSSPLVK